MIEFSEVCKSYGGQDVIMNATFTVHPGERIGVVGPNGAGKSTLFAMVTGELEPDKGRVRVPRHSRLGHLRQLLSTGDRSTPLLDFAADCSRELREAESRIAEIEHLLGGAGDSAPRRREFLLEELGRWQHHFEVLDGYSVASRAEAALAGLGFGTADFKRPLTDFSGGWQMRASLARVLLADPDILLLDEPSNYLDVPAIEWLRRFLADYEGMLMLISHDRYLLRALAGTIVEVNAARATRYPGGYDYYVECRESRAISAAAANRNLLKERERLSSNIDRFRAKSSKAAQARSWMRKLERIDTVAEPEKIVRTGNIRLPAPPACGEEIVSLDGVGFSYDGLNMILEGVDLRVGRGDTVAVIGANGAGKSTLLRMLAARRQPGKGKVRFGHGVVPGYMPQDFSETLDPGKTAWEVVRGAAAANATESSLRSTLGSFGFSGDDVHKRVDALSGGEKVRLGFVTIFVNPPNFLVLDEPTTHLDLDGRETLQRAIAAYQGTCCFVSHDIEFVRGAAKGVFAVANGGARVYLGGYDYYLEKSASDAEGEPCGGNRGDERKAGGGDPRAAARRERARQRQTAADEKKRLEKSVAAAERKIEKLEAERATLLGRLAAPEAGPEMASINRRLREIEAELAIETASWEEAAEKLEQLLESLRTN